MRCFRSLSVAFALVVVANAALTAAVPGGLDVAFYANRDLTEPAIVQTIDPTLDHNWGEGAPHAGLPKDDFSVRWQGFLVPRYTEPCTLYITSDDGIRVWVDGALLVDDWTDHSPRTAQATFAGVADQPHRLRVEFYERRGGAVARLEGASAQQSREVVPSAQLLSLGGIACTIPESSLVSPVFIEGERLPGVAVTTNGAGPGSVTSLGAAGFYANIPTTRCRADAGGGRRRW